MSSSFSCIKAIGFECFKLARSVLKIGSFEFINLQYFNSTFMNLKIARLVSNAKGKIVVSTQCHVSDCFVINRIWFTLPLIFICLQVMKKYLKYL